MAEDPKFTISGGTMKVHELGTGNKDPVDRPDVALQALDVFERAFDQGGEIAIEGPVSLELPNGGLRLIRGRETAKAPEES